MKLKKILPPALAFATVALVLYGAFAFANWNADPSQWEQEARSLYSFIAVLFGSVIAGPIAMGNMND